MTQPDLALSFTPSRERIDLEFAATEQVGG